MKLRSFLDITMVDDADYATLRASRFARIMEEASNQSMPKGKCLKYIGGKKGTY